ncbi:PPE family protein [Mycobacterium sp.]|uniref:PPE family protein n=1 Tax=Mycobacterium sp. TaxID=1785 RepID=UPI003D6BF8E1
MLDFGALPPEVNSTRMYAGAGSGPMMAAASAWDVLAGQLESVSRGYAAVIAGLQGEGWSGSASDAMADAAAPFVAWVATTGAKAEEAAIRARAAAGAYETAFAATVPPALVTANRGQLANLVATNTLGQNTTQIAATEAAYAEMWAQDAHAMYGYAASSSAATTLTPFSEPPPTTNAAGQPNQAAAVGQAVGSSTASQSQATLSRLMSAMPQQLQALTSGAPVTASTTPSASLVTGANAFNQLTGTVFYPSRTVTSAFSGITGLYRSVIQAGGSLPKVAPRAVTVGANALAPAGVRSPVLASVGRAAPIGGLSVPQSWASATPVASAVEEPLWLSEMDLGVGAPSEGITAASTAGGAPIAGVGPLAGMAGRHSVSSVLRVAPRRFRMPRPALGG